MEDTYKDQSTIISIYPADINEFKPGLYPGRFQLDACKNEELPKFLHIGLSIHMVNIPDKPPMPVETASYTIAKAIVRDFFDSQCEHDPENNAHPGIAALPGIVNLADFMSKHKPLHETMKKSQNAWGMKLVSENDVKWNRYKNIKMMYPLGIHFAKKFGFTAEQKPWLENIVDDIVKVVPKCPVCANAVSPTALVCTNCTPNFILKPKEYEELTKGRLVGKAA
jgi:hypothetical protein